MTETLVSFSGPLVLLANYMFWEKMEFPLLFRWYFCAIRVYTWSRYYFQVLWFQYRVYFSIPLASSPGRAALHTFPGFYLQTKHQFSSPELPPHSWEQGGQCATPLSPYREPSKNWPRDPVVNIVTIHAKHLRRVINGEWIWFFWWGLFVKITTVIHCQYPRNARGGISKIKVRFL